MLEKHKTLAITRHYFKRCNKKVSGRYLWKSATKSTSILEVEKVLNKTQMPFDLRHAYDFVDGKINRLVIDNGYDCIEVSYA